ncbi:peptidoglycan DD-metalloendopeptidase family protein [Bhargavaea ginsengi]|uniref:peptidoglycan DD-metalloendopeptidase family protein n=1 Tax=Bhargavaea ginsengi TaxID=426757 RepID=UPI002041561E|nr:peptidoglycan DD-metalloendopeptidase family protein [Bhargavaea ginsengi]MCM3086617.1 peptidoglycan DD-metalloendopeptidase family protein [Bhargavaea ginsengi]
MRWREKWVAALLVTVVLFGVAKLEEHQVMKTQITHLVRSGEELTVLKKWVMSFVDQGRPETAVPVIADGTTPAMAEFSSLQPFREGVVLSYGATIPVTAKGDGLVIYTGHTRQTGKTVTVQYDDGDTVTYGFIGKFLTLPYTTVGEGEPIAELETGAMFLGVERDGGMMDAEGVKNWLAALRGTGE